MVSVILTTYGRPLYLSLCIESVLNQTFRDLELIIVDDNNPTDPARKETEAVINNFKDERIKYIKHPQNLNGAVARNSGIKIATGEYISFLDSDDYYHPERLQKCVNLLDANPEINAVYTGFEVRVRGKKHYVNPAPLSGNFLKETLAAKFSLGTGSNIFIRRLIVNELGGFDEAFLRHQDYEFMARFFMRYNIAAIPEVLVIKNNENLNLPDPEKLVLIKKQYIAKFKDVINSLDEEDRNHIYHLHAISLAEQFLIKGIKEKSDSFYKSAKSYEPLNFKLKTRRIILNIIYLWKRSTKRI